MATTSRKPTPEEILALKAVVAGMSQEEKQAFAAKIHPVVAKKNKSRIADGAAETHIPQTDDELHAAIIRETGFNVPRVAVCEDHCAPFDLVAAGFFHRAEGILNLKSREAGGTLNASILMYMLCKYVPEHEGVQLGAIQRQAEKAYEYVTRFTQERTRDKDGNVSRRIKPEIEGEPMQKGTYWKNGSKNEIIVASVSGVNSPHPNTVHADEVDLMDQKVIDQLGNVSSSSLLADGTRIPALDLVVSTRKTMHGPMQKLIDEIAEAEEKGYEASYKLFSYCVAEIAEEVPCCRCADPDARRARLIELDRDPEEVCGCDKVVKGELAEGIPRTLQSVCRGRFFRSRGWMAHSDVKRKFRKNPQAVWEAEMECRRPMADGLYLPAWTRERYTVNNWVPRPEYGPVYTGTDWGGTSLSFVLWSQHLRVPVSFTSRQGAQIEVPRGSYVIFDELYDPDAGATRLADMVIAREISWRRQIPGFSVRYRFADMGGKQQRQDWRQHRPPLNTVWFLPNRDFDPTVRCLQGLVEDKHYWVDERCSHHTNDIESWRQQNGREHHTKDVHDPTHSMAASRYMHANTESLERKKRASDPRDSVMPVVALRETSAGVGFGGADRNSFAGEERWRSQLGGPVPRGWSR